ncbi:MAG: pirin family protein, partial [Turicibacter sp.]|nr:pirin family protein [Turicibacter sp.]
RKLDHRYMGGAIYNWLETTYHFSFANYYNEANLNFGVLRVLNDDIIAPHTGFESHSHQDMEILTYVIDGELTHEDSLGNSSVLRRGQMQYMSAGTGVTHSEYNKGDDPLRILQIWITPNKTGHQPTYGEYHFDWESRHNQWLHMVSDIHGDAPITINQDVNIYTILLDENNTADINVAFGRQAYLMQIEGFSTANGIALKEKDALEIIEDSIHIAATHTSHFIVIDMPKSGHPYM